MTEAIVYTAIFIASYWGVKLFRRWSLRRNLLDVPNERSSHAEPVPRGGGLLIVIISLFVYTIHTIFVSKNFAWSYFAGASAIAFVSWLDDLYDIRSIWRFLTHSMAAALLIFTLGYFQTIYVPFIKTADLGKWGAVLTFFWIVWLTNAYNFMDGIDGIAGMQAITAGVGWLIVGKVLDYQSAGFYGGALAFSGLGFLMHNWQPAKIFMGDVGSAFLGYGFAAMPLLAKSENGSANALLPLIAAGLVFPFIFDTLYTFLRRLLSREEVWRAHRSHIYQRLVIRGFSHRFVTILYSFVSMVFTIAIVFWLIHKRKI